MTQDELNKAITQLHMQVCGAFGIPPRYLGMRKTIVGWRPAPDAQSAAQQWIAQVIRQNQERA